MPVLTEELARLRKNASGRGGHRWQVSSLVFSPDGSRLASGSWDKEVRIWELSSLETKHTLKGVHKVPVTSLSWQDLSGRLLCVGSADCTASLWNSSTGKQVGALTRHDGWVLDVSFARGDSTQLATASWDSFVRTWDPETRALVRTFSGHEKGVWSVDFKPTKGSTILCSGSEDGSIKLWDTRADKTVRTFEGGHSQAVYSVCWSADGAMIASGSEDTKICIWEPGSGALINTIQVHTDIVKSVYFNPQTVNVSLPVLASAGGYTVNISDPRPGFKSSIITLSPHMTGKEVETIVISPDGSLLVSGGRDGDIVLMTLMVPRLLPSASEHKAYKQRAGQRRAKEDVFIKDITHEMEDEEEMDIAAEELDQLDDILSSPLQQEVEQNVSRLKRISRTAAKELELQEHSTVKKNVSAKSSRKKRTVEKNIDLPTMISHLAGNRKSAVIIEEMEKQEQHPVALSDKGEGNEEIEEDEREAVEEVVEEEEVVEDEEEENNDFILQPPPSFMDENERFLPSDTASESEMRFKADSTTSEGTDDPEAQFLDSGGIPHSSTHDTLKASSALGHYSMLDHLDSSILLMPGGKQGKKGAKIRPTERIPEALSLSAVSTGSEFALELEDEEYSQGEQEESILSEI